jgi:ribosome-binding factor A
MDSKRQLKVARLIQKELSQLFITNLRELVLGEMVTVSYVKVTPDLREARVYLSFMLKKDYQPLMDNLNNHVSKVRGAIGKNLGNSMRVVPSFEFYYDDTFDYTDEMNALLEGLDIPKKDEDAKD